MSMEERIKIERGEAKPSEVSELILDTCRAPQIEGLTAEYESLEVLSMINCGLTTLKGFPALPKLHRLELSDNRLAGELEYLKGCPNISNLKISNNRIADLSAIEPLKSLADLESLDLIECPIANSETYRDDVFLTLPHLKFLNGIDREGNQEPDSDEDFELDEEEEDLSDVGSEEDDEEEEESDNDDDDEEADEDKEEDKEETAENGDKEEEEEEEEEPVAKKLKLTEEAEEAVSPQNGGHVESET